MPVYHACKLIYIHVPKTGGTSMRAALDAGAGKGAEWNTSGLWPAILSHKKRDELFRTFERLFPLKSPLIVAHQHLPACMLRELVDPRVWESYYKYAMVRNPWDYTVSMYHFLRQALPDQDSFLNRQHQDLAFLVRQCPEFGDWVRLMTMFEPDMSSFFTDAAGNNIVDYVARYETLDRDFAQLSQRIGIAIPLPRLNTSSRTAYRDYYNEETKAIVGQHFARDIERFGYSF